MKVVLINGSPRGRKSTSLNILSGLKAYLQKGESIELLELTWNRVDSGVKDFDKVLDCDAIVFAFPLYIDSIPSHLLRNLIDFDKYINYNKSKFKDIKIYTIINNGFFDGKQNYLAMENIKHWSRRVGFSFEQGIGIGGGGMLPSVVNVPFGAGPKKSIGNALEKMAENIKNQKGQSVQFIEPNFPKLAYKLSAQMGWRMNANSNGLRWRDLGKKINL